MRQFLLLIGCLLLLNKAHTQSVLSGVVKDAISGRTLAGAVVYVKGKARGITDEKGIFSIPCTGSASLQVSYLGYATQQIKVLVCQNDLLINLFPQENTLTDIEITSTSTQNKSMIYQPQSIVRVSRAEMNRGNGLYLDDAINSNVPGVTMQRRAISSGQQFNIRGYGGGMGSPTRISSNFDGQGVKVYLNGIPLTDAEGVTIMDDIDFANLGNIEVLKGPAGSLYGLAIAGVVNMRSITPEKGKTTIEQEVMVGSFDLRRFTTRFATSGEKYNLLVTYGKQSTSGFAAHMDSKKDFVNVAYEATPSDRQTITAYAGYSNSYDSRGGELTISQYARRDYSGNPEYIKRNAHSEVISFRAGVGHIFKLSERITHHFNVFGTGINSNASSASGWTDKNPLNYGLRTTLDMRFKLTPEIYLNGINGVEMQQQRTSLMAYNMVANPTNPSADWIIGPMRTNQMTLSATASYFSEWTLGLPKNWSVTAGLGYSNMRIQLNDRFYVAGYTGPTQFEKKYAGMFSPRLAVNKVFNNQRSVYATFSRGFKAPVSSYFIIPATGQLNTGLRPERGDQVEVGSKGSLLRNKLSYELAFFRTVFNDKMTAIAVPLDGSTTTTAYSFVANGGKQIHQGAEVLIKYQLIENSKSLVQILRPFGNLTLNDCKYKGYSFQTLNSTRTGVLKADYDGKKVAGVAPFVANLGMDWKLRGGWYGNWVFHYRESFPFTADGTNLTASYGLWNAKMGYQSNLTKHWTLDMSYFLNNLTNIQYPTMVFANQLPDAYVPAPDISNGTFSIQLKYTF